MLVRRLARGVTIGLMLAVFTRPTPARACSCDFQGPGRFYLGSGGRLPRDALGIPWAGPNPLLTRHGAARKLHERVTLTRRVGDRERPEKFTVVQRGHLEFIVPAGGLAPGDVLTITVREYGFMTPRELDGWRSRYRKQYLPLELPHALSAVVTVTADVVTLGSADLRLSPRVRQIVRRDRMRPASCVGERESDTIDIATVLPPALEPYRDYLLYGMRVDGERRRDQRSNCQVPDPGRSWTDEPGSDRVFSECVLRDATGDYDWAEGERFGLVPGLHTVTMDISTPDGAQTIVTPAQVFELGCDPPPAVVPVPVPPSEPEPPPEPPAPGVPPAAAAPPVEQGPPPTSAPRGCRSAEVPGPWWMAVLLRRRRRSSQG